MTTSKNTGEIQHGWFTECSVADDKKLKISATGYILMKQDYHFKRKMPPAGAAKANIADPS